MGVSGERVLEFSCVDIPEANRFVATATSECVAIWTETRVPDSEECLSVFAGVNIPELNCSVSTPTGERASIRTKTHMPDSIGVSGEGISVFGGSDIP